MADSDSEEDQKINYEEDYGRKFSRKIQFPRLEIEDIVINPVHTEYFYITKTQAIDENFIIQNYVSTEDYNRINELIEEKRSRMNQDSDDDSDGEHKRDLFEEALEQMRENKEYNIDEEGMTKVTQGVTVVTRGTRTSEVVQNFIANPKSKVGAGFDDRNPQESAIVEESAEETSQQEDSATPDDEEHNSEDDESNNSNDDEGGESEPSEDEESKVEKSKSAEEDEGNVEVTKTKTKKTGISAAQAENANLDTNNDLVKKSTILQSAEEAKRLIEEQLNEEKNKREQEANKNPAEAQQNEENKEENEEEEKYSEEQVRFIHYDVENSGATLRSKPHVLILCKLEAFGYTVKHKLYSESDLTDDNFKFSREKYFSSCGNYLITKSNKSFVVYDAMNLTEKYRYTLDENADDVMGYYSVVLISFDAKYICIKAYNKYKFFDGRTGEYLHDFDSNQYQYTKFINSKEMIGTCFDQSTGFSKIGKYSVSGKEESELVSFGKYYPSIIPNSDGKACLLEHDNVLYYLDLKSGDKDPVKLMEGYEVIRTQSIVKDFCSVFYSEESKFYFALYEKSKLIFRKKVDFGSSSYSSVISSNLNNQIIYVDDSNSKKTIFIIDEDNLTDVSFDFDVKFHYPYIFYGYEKNEIWIQKVDEPYKVQRYVFINTITAFDLTDDVYFGDPSDWYSSYKRQKSLGLILTYETHHKIAEFTFRESEEPLLLRVQKPIKFSELPNANILSFVRLEGKNDKNSLEPCIMFHYLNQVKFYYLKSGKIKKQYDKRFAIRNIIPYSDKIYFWEDRGRTIERLDTPIAKDEKQFFYKVYDAKNAIKLCKKSTYFLNGGYQDCLLICDEDKYIKILIYDSQNKKFIIEREYFVSSSFAVYEEPNVLESYCYSNGILYNNESSYLLQERENNKADIEIRGLERFKSYAPCFPLCSNNFILKQLDTNQNNYYYESKKKPFELYLCPPYNSHKLKISSPGYDSFEYFLHSDNSKIIQVSNDYNILNIKLSNQNGTIYDQYGIERNYYKYGKFCVSRNGKYFCSINVEDKKYNTTIRSIDIKKNESDTHSEPVNDQNHPSQEVNKVKEEDNKSKDSESNQCKFDVREINHFIYDLETNCENSNYAYISYENELKWSVTNDGHTIGVSFTLEKFYINGQDIYHSIQSHIKTLFKDVEKTKEGKYKIYKENITMGEDSVIIKLTKSIVCFRFNVENLKVYDFKKINHTPVNEFENIYFNYIVTTTHNDRILMVYTFKTGCNIIVWDIKTNEEFSNFASREEDNFMFYVQGDQTPELPEENDSQDKDENKKKKTFKLSKTGYLVFDNYYVDIETMIPAPFMTFRNVGLTYEYWNYGPRMNNSETHIVVGGNLYFTYSYQDIFFRSHKDTYATQRIDACKYNIEGHTVLSDFVMEDEKLGKILDLLQTDPIYYLMIVTKNKKGITPLEEAIQNNSPKIVELFLANLQKMTYFKKSTAFYKKFPDLFEMGVEQFRWYLNICTFQTGQMQMMKKMDTKGKDGVQHKYSNSSILGDYFNRIFFTKKEDIEKKKKQQEDAKAEEEKNKSESLKDSDDDDDKEEETLMSDVSIPDIDYEVTKTDEIKTTNEKRVEVFGIEFDWVLSTSEGEEFLQQLSETENLGFFEIDVVKHIIMFQWSYFLPKIIIYLFTPFIVHFLLFILYTTWILDKKYNYYEKWNNWYTASFSMGIAILVFQVFFIYIEIHQLIFHKLNYFKSFWNMLDISSILLNIAVVVCDFTRCNVNDIIAIACVAVLVLWFRLFYLLRVFKETAYLISMIQAIIIEMKYFVLALAIAIIAFANTFFILGRNSPDGANFSGNTIWDAFIFSYRMGLGDFDTSGFGTTDEGLIWVLWFLNTLIILIILLNLVIAIMGDTFDRVQETQESTMLQEFACIMRENEFMFNRKSIFKNVKYIIVIQPERAEGGITTSWEGKLNQLKKFLEESSSKHIEHLNKMEKKMCKMIENGLEEKLKPTEDKINNKIAIIELRLQKLNKIFIQYPIKDLLEKVNGGR